MRAPRFGEEAGADVDVVGGGGGADGDGLGWMDIRLSRIAGWGRSLGAIGTRSLEDSGVRSGRLQVMYVVQRSSQAAVAGFAEDEGDGDGDAEDGGDDGEGGEGADFDPVGGEHLEGGEGEDGGEAEVEEAEVASIAASRT